MYCQMVAGRDAAKPGEGKNSWLTGTAAWNWYAVSEYILGIKPDYDALVVNPCLPKSLGRYTVTRRFRGATYEITVVNKSGRGKLAKPVRLPLINGTRKFVVEI